MAILLQFWSIKPRFVRKCSPEATNGNFTAVFGDRTSFRAKLPDNLQIAILPQFLAIEPHFVRKGSPDNLNDQTHFVRKGCDRMREIAILPQFLAIELHFVRKACARTACGKSQFFYSFWRSNFISCERVATGCEKSQFYLQFLAIEPHFVRKGCDRMREIAILLQFLAIEPHVARIL